MLQSTGHIEVNGTPIWYGIYDHNPQADKETILFSHGLLFSGDMFLGQVEELSKSYKCVVYDHRGQARSGLNGPFDMDTLTSDAIQLIEVLNLGSVHFVGLSMGGFVGMRLAINHKELVRTLTLMDTSADPEVFVFKYNMLVQIVKLFGVSSITSRVMKIMFSPHFLADPEKVALRTKWKNWLKARPKAVIGPVKGVIDRNSVFDQLGKIECPTLVIVGEDDAATTPDKSERMVKAISNARLVTIPKAGHSSSIEQPEVVLTAMAQFLSASR
ncbi:MAG: 3-oxoadipate enol-lactonase [Limisphaerales bacterium]|jgi:3-oxoadipate enol-lactonase